MPRQARIDEPGMFHHVTLRGVAASDVFRDDADRLRFISFAASYVRSGGARCHAWALMDNHVHLVVRTGVRTISQVVHGFAFRYAHYFNWRHARPGHLFQGRFGSEPIEDDDYLRTAITYVHLNPVRAGMVTGLEALADYRWTSFAGLLGNRPDPLVSVEDTLALLASEAGAARTALVSLTGSCLRLAEQDPHWHWATGRASGSEAAPIDTEALMRRRMDDLQSVRDLREAARVRTTRLRRDGWTTEAVVAAVCALLRVGPPELASPARRRPLPDARALVACLAVRELGATVAEVARTLGMCESATGRALVRGDSIARERGLRLGDGPLAREVAPQPPAPERCAT